MSTSKSSRGHRRKQNKTGKIPAKFVLVIVGCLLSQCVAPLSYREEKVPNRGASRVFKASPKVVMAAVKRVMVKRGLPVRESQDRATQVESDWLTEGRVRTRLLVEIKPAAGGRQAEMNAIFAVEEQDLFGGRWRPSDKIGPRVYHDFMEDVQMEIYRVIYDSP